MKTKPYTSRRRALSYYNIKCFFYNLENITIFFVDILFSVNLLEGENMKAIILSGGKGTRLRPLTDKKPKPLVTVGDKPIIELVLKNLAKGGIKEAAITLGYRGDDIRRALGDEAFGIKLCYFEEKEPLGTAGGVKNCESFIDSDFLVLSADAVFELDFERLISSHKISQKTATMVLTGANEPLEYGVVLLKKDGTVRAFSEKPSWEGVKSDLVNCGIYLFKKDVLNIIPKGLFSDFSSDIFPKMLELGLDINTFITRSFWCDAGSFSDLYACNSKTLSEGFFHRYVPENVTLKSGAKTSGSVIGKGSVAEEDSIILHSVIGRDCHIGKRAKIDGAILGDRVRLGDGATVERGAVIGDDSYIGNGHTVKKGTHLESDTHIESDDVYGSFGSLSHLAPKGEFYFSIDNPESAFLLGRAATGLGGDLGVIHTSSEISHLAAESFALGAAWGGENCIIFSDASTLDAPFISGYFSMYTFAFEEHGKELSIRSFSPSSLPLSHEEGRMVTSLIERPKSSDTPGSIRYFDGLDISEKQYFNQLFNSSLIKNTKIAVKANENGKKLISYIKNDSFHLAKSHFAEDFFIDISDDRKNISLTFSKRIVDTSHVHALILKSLAASGRKSFFLTGSAPEALKTIARAYGAKIVVTNNNHPWESSDVFLDIWQRDALFAAPLLLKVLAEHSFSREKLEKTLDSLPVFLCVERDFKTKGFPVGSIMRELEKNSSLNKECGVALTHGDGVVTITPENRESFKIFAEAGNSEYAEELCGFAQNLIDKIINKKG